MDCLSVSKMSVSSASAFVDDNGKRLDAHLFSTLDPDCDSRLVLSLVCCVRGVWGVYRSPSHGSSCHSHWYCLPLRVFFFFFLGLKVSFNHLGKIRWKSVIFLHLRSLCITEWWYIPVILAFWSRSRRIVSVIFLLLSSSPQASVHDFCFLSWWFCLSRSFYTPAAMPCVVLCLTFVIWYWVI